MLKDPAAVRSALQQKVLQGLDPTWDEKSCEDYLIDWKTLSEIEFMSIKDAALHERRSLAHPKGGDVGLA